jgi:hypothetical protein
LLAGLGAADIARFLLLIAFIFRLVMWLGVRCRRDLGMALVWDSVRARWLIWPPPKQRVWELVYWRRRGRIHVEGVGLSTAAAAEVVSIDRAPCVGVGLTAAAAAEVVSTGHRVWAQRRPR